MRDNASKELRTMYKGTKAALVMICAAWLAAAGVQAASQTEFPDPDKTGSITVTLRSGEDAVQGGTLDVYQVAETVSDSGFHFAYTDMFADFAAGELTSKYSDPGQPEYIAADVFPAETSAVYKDNVSANREMAEDLAAYIANNTDAIEPLGTLSIGTGEENTTAGSGTFRGADDAGLSLGLYLFIQNETARDHQPVSPFLVSVPRMVDGTYVYDVDAFPKPGGADAIDPAVQACPSIIKKIAASGNRTKEINDLPDGTYFRFRFKALDKAYPMPVNGQGSVRNGGPVVSQSGTAMELQIDGRGTIGIGTITFSGEGEYYYEVRELAGNSKDFSYDDRVYWLKYTVEPNEDHTALTVSEILIRDEDAEGEQLYPVRGVDKPVFTFTNVYSEEETESEKGKNTPGGNSSNTSEKGSSLPQTGQLWWPVWILMAGGMMLIAAGIILRRKKS